MPMSTYFCCSDALRKGAAWLAGATATILVVGGLACYLFRTTPQEPVGSVRAMERKRISTELQAQSADALANYGVLKADTGVFRLPVSKAMEVMADEWKNGNAAGRAKLLERLANSQKAASYE
jgi:hypothetical protein